MTIPLPNREFVCHMSARLTHYGCQGFKSFNYLRLC